MKIGQPGPLDNSNYSKLPMRTRHLYHSLSLMVGHTYVDTGDKMVWVRGGASGLNKRQCTAQTTLFADGEPRVKQWLILKARVNEYHLGRQSILRRPI